MIKTIQLSAAERELPSGAVSKVRGLNSSGASVTTTPEDICKAAGYKSYKVAIQPSSEVELDANTGGLCVARVLSLSNGVGCAIFDGVNSGIELKSIQQIRFFL